MGLIIKIKWYLVLLMENRHITEKALTEYDLSMPDVMICLAGSQPDAQWRFKLSYYVEDTLNEDDIANLYKFWGDYKLRAKVLLTEN